MIAVPHPILPPSPSSLRSACLRGGLLHSGSLSASQPPPPSHSSTQPNCPLPYPPHPRHLTAIFLRLPFIRLSLGMFVSILKLAGWPANTSQARAGSCSNWLWLERSQHGKSYDWLLSLQVRTKMARSSLCPASELAKPTICRPKGQGKNISSPSKLGFLASLLGAVWEGGTYLTPVGQGRGVLVLPISSSFAPGFQTAAESLPPCPALPFPGRIVLTLSPRACGSHWDLGLTKPEEMELSSAESPCELKQPEPSPFSSKRTMYETEEVRGSLGVGRAAVRATFEGQVGYFALLAPGQP